MKKIFVGTLIVLLLMGIVNAYETGDTVNFNVNLQCGSRTVDTDLTDGEATYIYYSYKLTDPDDIVRDDLGITQISSNSKSVSKSMIVDKAGIWTLEGKMIYIHLVWNGVTFDDSDSGICDTKTHTEIIEEPYVPVCGDGVIEGDEECDGSNLGGETCESKGYDGGALLCNSCSFEVSECYYAVAGQRYEITKDAKVAQAMPTYKFGAGRYTMIAARVPGIDRVYIGIDLTEEDIGEFNHAVLNVPVYATGKDAIGVDVDAYYCPDHNFNEYTINWNNQVLDWQCILADTSAVSNAVAGGSPETWHTFDITDELRNDREFTVVLKFHNENWYGSYRKILYMSREYSAEYYRPHIEVT